MMIHCSAGLSAVNAEERSSAALPPRAPVILISFAPGGSFYRVPDCGAAAGLSARSAPGAGGGEAARRARSVMGVIVDGEPE